MRYSLPILLSVVLVSVATSACAQKETGGGEALKALQEAFSTDASLPTASEDVVRVAARLPEGVVAGGSAFEVVVMLRVADGWHVNAHQPTLKYLIGTTLDVERRAGLRVVETRYPAPLLRAFRFAADTLAVYEGEVSIVLSMRASTATRPGTQTVQGMLRLQACNDEVCLKPSTVIVPLPVEVVGNE